MINWNFLKRMLSTQETNITAISDGVHVNIRPG